ncbi:MAG: YaiI/YqxD family protein [Gemmatimonadota bacterium]|nr:YaiI/YqxD family protein [Gemmatimonadota bacterium]
MIRIFVDADACPVKEEVYRVAQRYDLEVLLVSNSWLRTPLEGRVELVLVGEELDAADTWITEHITKGDIVVSADIPLAATCLGKGALVLGPRGQPFTEHSIGNALATRELMSQLREMGEITGGPPPFEKRDRSKFLQALDQIIHASRRSQT